MTSNRRPLIARLASHGMIVGIAGDAGCSPDWLGAAVVTAIADVGGVVHEPDPSLGACATRFGSFACANPIGHSGQHVAYDGGSALTWRTDPAHEPFGATLNVCGVVHDSNMDSTALKRAKADAWDEGREAMGDDIQREIWDGIDERTTNPYREEDHG